MSKLDIRQESKQQLWSSIEKFFLNHPNPIIFDAFKSQRHDRTFQNSLVAAAVEIIYIAQQAAFSLRAVLPIDLYLHEAVNAARTDTTLEIELKLFLINNFITENISQAQIDMIMGTHIRNKNTGMGHYGNMRGQNVSPAPYTNKELQRFCEILMQFKRDYISIMSDKEYMNPEHEKAAQAKRDASSKKEGK